MISRSFLSSIAFRLPFAIVFICILVFSLSAIAIYGLQRARDEMAAYGLQAFPALPRHRWSHDRCRTWFQAPPS